MQPKPPTKVNPIAATGEYSPIFSLSSLRPSGVLSARRRLRDSAETVWLTLSCLVAFAMSQALLFGLHDSSTVRVDFLYDFYRRSCSIFLRARRLQRCRSAWFQHLLRVLSRKITVVIHGDFRVSGRTDQSCQSSAGVLRWFLVHFIVSHIVPGEPAANTTSCSTVFGPGRLCLAVNSVTHRCRCFGLRLTRLADVLDDDADVRKP